MILDEKRQRHLNYIHKSGTRIRMQVGKWVQKEKAKMTLEQARSMHADASELFFFYMSSASGAVARAARPRLTRLSPACASAASARLPNKLLPLIHHHD